MVDVVTTPSGPTRAVALWTLRVLLGLTFLAAAAMKLTGQPMMIAEFATIGLGQWFRYLTGLLELIGGIAILLPVTSAFGALLLLLIDVGALVAQVSVLHMDWVHTIVIGALLVCVVVLQRDRILRATSLSRINQKSRR